MNDDGMLEGSWSSSPLSRLSPVRMIDEVTATALFTASTNGDGLTWLEDARERGDTPAVGTVGRITFVAGTVMTEDVS